MDVLRATPRWPHRHAAGRAGRKRLAIDLHQLGGDLDVAQLALSIHLEGERIPDHRLPERYHHDGVGRLGLLGVLLESYPVERITRSLQVRARRPIVWIISARPSVPTLWTFRVMSIVWFWITSIRPRSL